MSLVYFVEQLELRAGTTIYDGSASLPGRFMRQRPRICDRGQDCTDWASASTKSVNLFGEAEFDPNFLPSLDTWLVPPAEAALPLLVPIGGALLRAGASVSGRQLATAAVSKGKSLWTTVESFWTSSAAPRMGQTITQGAAKAPKYYSQKVLAATGAAGVAAGVALDETARQALGAPAQANQASAPLPPIAPGEEVPRPPPLPAPVVGATYARQEGAFCIFGGYVSEYKKFGDDL